MNRDINFTLSALVPLLRMNGEKVVSVEAVEDWYEIDGREYMKEVAEITYENGYRQYADIGCDANLTAVYDVIRVIQQVKPKSEKIERIVRDVYPKPEVTDINVGKMQLSEENATKDATSDTISRKAVMRAIDEALIGKGCSADGTMTARLINDYVIKKVPPAEPKTGKWIYHIDDLFPAESTKECDQCHAEQPLTCDDEFCPHCGAKMEVTE